MPRLKLAEPEENRSSSVCWSAELASILNTQKDANLTSLQGTNLIAVGSAHGAMYLGRRPRLLTVSLAGTLAMKTVLNGYRFGDRVTPR